MPALHTFSWIGPGGIENLRFIVVQVGRTIQVIDTSVEPYSEGVIYQEVLDIVGEAPKFSFATVNGELVIATNQADILIYSYEDGSISKRTGRVKIRDMFGVEDVWEGQDLTEGMGLIVRPTELTGPHLYNLRNQTFATPKINSTDNILYLFQYGGQYPSNADNLHYALSPAPTQKRNPQGDHV